MWIDTCILIKKTEQKNSFGANINTNKSIESEIFCNKKSIGQNESYQLSKLGFKGELKLEIYKLDYNDETLVEFEEKRYKIQRIYEARDILELTCIKAVVGND